MIGISLPEYLFIRTSIAFLRVITPLSVAYCIACVAYPPKSVVFRFLLAWAALESTFYLLGYLLRKQSLQQPAVHPTLVPETRRRELFERCYQTISNPEYYLAKWFLGGPAEEIKRENVKEFFRWAFLNTAHRDAAHEEELEHYADGVESLLGRKLPQGHGSAKCLRLTIDAVDMMHRPLIYYAVRSLCLPCPVDLTVVSPDCRNN